jgi:CheY-like chemotaxis protein
VLIVDDNRTLAECTRRLLEALGYQALACSDPLQAQTLCSGDSQQDFHLLLTDYAMPQMNGYQLARGLQQSHPRLRVLLCSAWPEDMIREDHLSEEQLPFMEKPFTLETLATRVRQVLDEQVTSESLAAGA